MSLCDIRLDIGRIGFYRKIVELYRLRLVADIRVNLSYSRQKLRIRQSFEIEFCKFELLV